ncbi:MAG: zf-HC2 domain-containing protein [Bacteroidota bacterium]|nr:zf-HC2 domain-containing protein [Bacteroidota bacterium]
MSKHSDILNQLYDYLSNEIPVEDRSKLEKHLAFCQSCAKELEVLKSFMEMRSLYISEPCNARTQKYWNNFAFDIERRIQSSEIKKQKSLFSVWVKLNSFFIFHKRPIIAYSSTLVVLLLAIFVWRLNIPPTVEQVIEQQPAELTEVKRGDDRVEEYFRKSKVLLVGIANMDIQQDKPIDLATERKASRELIHEARYLQRQPLDFRSAQLINDLEKILIELANMEKENDLPNIEMIQGGIHKKNLLFKIRMAESMYEQPRFMNANHITEGDLK